MVDPVSMVVLFGAGGAARAIGVELAIDGAKRITVVNRTKTRGQELADLLNGRVREKAADGFEACYVPWEGDHAVADGTDVVVNATSIGLHPDVDTRIGLSLDSLKPSMVVADVIPNPPKTRLVRDASERGCRVIDGLGMLVNQGIIGIKFWTGVDVDAKVMRDKLTEIFGA